MDRLNLNWKKNLNEQPLEVFLLMEECHLNWIDEKNGRREWGLLLNRKPHVAWYIAHKAPKKAAWVRAVMEETEGETVSPQELAQMEEDVLAAYEDWVTYATDPEDYNRQPFLNWEDREMLDVTDFAGKRVVDIGSGTGRQAFLAAGLAQAVYCVEPVYNLRKFLLARAEREGRRNLFVMDGLITRLPFENDFADIITGGHVFGDEPEAELGEMLRVLKPGGTLLLIPGNNDQDNAEHRFLVNAGFSYARFQEPGDGMKRKYWLVKPHGGCGGVSAARPVQKGLEIRYKRIVLRDYRESDIADEIRWNTVETQWALWDAPWETAEELSHFDPDAFRREQLDELKKPVEGFRWSMEVDTADGVHIGSVNTYLIDEAYAWVKSKDVMEKGQRVFYTLGIEINESSYWSQGLGTQALAAYIRYQLAQGHEDICLQTWSGNLRMVRCAEKLGFSVCGRAAGIRKVRGGVYDGLTFYLDREKFQAYLKKEEEAKEPAEG